MSQNNRLLFPNQDSVPSFGTVTADSSDSALLAGQDALVCVYDGAAYIYFGKASGTWETLWVDTTGGLLRGDTGGTYAVALASDGPEPFDAAYGFATDKHAGNVSASTTFTHSADFLLPINITTYPTALLMQVNFRVVDADNRWILWIQNTGSCNLFERAGGGSTTRASASITPADSSVAMLIGDQSTISLRFQSALVWSYASATNFATATAGELVALGTGGVVSNLYSWPRYASTVAATLDKVSA